jgi:CO/xanthine dehydrogenase Mo-binding subunit/aerobic-type carbon monoxide dehydrogenase small subunit (CoxS/CutS family)
VEPDTPLLYVLRNDLRLKGTKFACGLEQCGACKIIIDGQAVPSCRIPVHSVQDCEITTIEGLGAADELHPLQKAFIDEQAVQCGFCVSGMIIAAKALLDRNPCPNDADIQAEMSGNLCRCGVYERVLRAIKRAAGQNVNASVCGEGVINEQALKPETRSFAPAETLPQSLVQTPDLDAWIRINDDGTITLFTGKVELGQDMRTSVAIIGAEELDVSLERIRVVMGDTAQTPNEGYTAGSRSLETTGNAIRYAAAEVRQIALTAAAEKLDTSTERLTVTDGVITSPATVGSVSYWDLFGGKRFGCQVRGVGSPKRPEAYRIAGRYKGRLDLLTKVTGGAWFIHDLDLSGMVHGRIIRPPGYGARLVSVEEGAVSQVPGIIQVVRDGSFLAVLAEREEQAVQGMEMLRKTAAWEPGKALPTQESLFDHLLSRPDQAFLVVDGTPVERPIPPIEAPEGAAKTLTATYHRPYHMHASLGPSAAVAQWNNGKLTVWTHNQGVYPLRADLAQVLGIPEEAIRAIHMDGPGCFGHNGADDAALDAALLARALPGRPVSVKWMRSDENKWEPFGSPAVVKIQASLNSDGRVIDWNHDVWSYTHTTRPRGEKGASGLLAAYHLAEPYTPPKTRPNMGPLGGIHRNADPFYTFPRRRIVKHFLPDSPLRVSALRSLGSYANVFAIESFMDELAHAAGVDPVEFRLAQLGDERARAVIRAAVEKAGRRQDNRGRGIAFARYKNRQSYLAVVMDVSVNRADGHICLERAVVAADAGQIVNPDAVRNQLEGVIIQSSSWTLKEQVTFDPSGISSVDWDSYPIFRFIDAPKIETVLLNRPGQPYLGIGEGAQGPVPAAIANAVFDATGIRLRHIPFTPERVKAALQL